MDIQSQTVQKYSIFSYLLIIAMLAGAYFVFGLLGLFSSVSTSHAGTVWPPAGIGLASLLLFGGRVWPGIFIGNFFISAWAFDFNSETAVIYLATGAGATGCALTGNFLIRRFVGFPNSLIADKAIIGFLLLGGPLSCLIPATVGLTAMATAGIISPGEIPFNWFSWWTGDTIGVLVFAPLMLILFNPTEEIWRRRRMSVGLPLIASLLLVIFFFLFASRLENDKQYQQFNNISKNQTQALINRIESHLNTIYSVRNLFLSSQQVEIDEFSFFAKHPLSQFRELNSIRWIVFNGPDKKAKIVFSESQNKNHLNNQSSQPKQPETLSRQFSIIAKLMSTQPSNLNVSPKVTYSDKSFQFYLPIYNKSVSNQRSPPHLQGLIHYSISIPILIEEAFKGLNTKGVMLSIATITPLGKKVSIFSYPGTNDLRLNPKLYLQQKISISNQQLSLVFLPDPDFFKSHDHWSVWWVLISGLLYTSLLGVSLLILTGRYFRTEAIVEARTKELTRENNSRRKAEQELNQAINKAESASNAKSQFLSNISHELRTPLNGILGFTELLLKNSTIGNVEKEKIRIINNCGDYLLTLINDILDISKIESRKLEIKPAPFDLKCFLFDIFSVFKLKAEQKNIFFTIHQDDTLPQAVNGDEKRIRQIFINLMGNAIRFTERGGVTVSISYNNGFLHLNVQDTGCGIAEEDCEKIFQPFVQINHPLLSQQGTGLGLSITDQLIKLMRGRISVTSTLNKGCLFSVLIPLQACYQKTVKPITKKKIIGYQGLSRSILIVEDNDQNILLLKTQLQELNFDVSAVKSGSECLEFCSIATPDLIFMDMMMPGLDGTETTRRLMANKPSGTYHIVGMSASVFTQDKQNFLDSGCEYFIAKPIKHNVLLSCIEEALGLQWIYHPQDEPPHFNPCKILIVDDNEINRLLLKNMLENLKCIVEMAGDGKEAKDMLMTSSYDLAIIDLNMPIIGGLDLVMILRNQPGPNRLIPVAAISAFADEKNISRALDAGFNDYITKPISENDLKQLLQSINTTA